MGLFDSLLKKTAVSSTPVDRLDNFPELFTGMKAEVLTPANALIFVGKLRLISGGDVVEIRGKAGGVIPRGLYNQPVKLRCYQRDGGALTLNGVVAQNSFDFWRIEKLDYPHNTENRNYFRQNAGTEGYILSSTSSMGRKIPCKVLDISAGGARVVTERLFTKEDVFQLEAAFLPGEEPHCINCKIMRVMVRSTPGSPSKKYEYGCQFVDLSDRDQDRLLQSIFTLQRKSLRARRNQ